ncbi:MAG: class I SAM-dependent methyltransferase [Acetobacteraceae bacterium]|nr:class I SAM-dependent methyltransferase [Acetobacteraceae bacterium]
MLPIITAKDRVVAVNPATEDLGHPRKPRMTFQIKNVAQKFLGHYGYEIRRPLGSYDAATIKIIERVRPLTWSTPEQIFALKSAVEYVVNNDIPGDFVECGVWKGGGAMVVALTLLNLGARRRFHLFDTFKGLPAPSSSIDRDLYGDTHEHWAGINVTSLEETKANLRSTGYDEDLITYVKGPVEQTVSANAPATIALLRLDTEWYESVRLGLQHLFPRLSGGGVLIVADYGHYEGARKATDDFMAASGVPLLLNRIDYSGRMCVKPLALQSQCNST